MKIAQMVSFFENSSRNVKPTTKHVKSPPKLTIPVQIQQKIIMPAGGIPKYYGVPSKPRTKSPKLIKNVEIAKEPEKIDKEKIKQNMENMKELIVKKGVYKRPFRIEPPNYNSFNNQQNPNPNQNQNQNQYQNQNQNQPFSQSKFLAAKSVFEPKNNNVYENKPIKKDVKKKAKITFHE